MANSSSTVKAPGWLGLVDMDDQRSFDTVGVDSIHASCNTTASIAADILFPEFFGASGQPLGRDTNFVELNQLALRRAVTVYVQTGKIQFGPDGNSDWANICRRCSKFIEKNKARINTMLFY